RIGPYEVLEEIGRGGMGIVYRARDTRLGRLVAIKLLPPWLSADPAAKERLAAEARSASAIDHPNIAALYDVVDTPSGALALVMAHYEGETLSERIAPAPLPVDEAMEIARQVASGLTAAHRHGIVHRDIKPANLFLTRDGLVKILDFGVAKALRAGVVASRSGRGAGTAAYMSPEQVRGIEIDHRTDLWSLGVVLHEMVTGMRPFPGDREAAVMRSILEDEPPPPDPPGGMAPPHLTRILAVLLAKDPDDRYADAATLFSEVTTSRHRPRFHQRARVTSAILLGFLLVLAWAVRPREPGSETPMARVERVAVLPFAVHGSTEFDYLGEAIVDLLSTGLDGAGEMRAVDPATLLDQAGDEVSGPREAERLAAGFGARLYVLGDIIEVDGRLRVRAVAYDRSLGSEAVVRANVEGSAEQMFNLVDELAAQLLVGLQVEGADRHTLVAQRTTSSLPALKAFLTGRRALRQGRFRQAVESLQQAVARDSMFALAYYELSKAAAWGRQMTFSTVAANRSLELADRLPQRERLLVLAYHAYLEGSTAQAEALYRQVLAAYPSSADAWVGMGELLFHYNPLRGRPKLEAVPYFERAIEFDPRFGEAIFHLMQVAVLQNDRQRFDELLGALPDEELVWRTLGVLTWGTAAEQSAALGELALASEHEILLAMEAVEFAGDLEMAERVARLLDEPSRPVEWRALA
ncbi:MAG: protein kinase domain-containing protein, partial [Acidimicrobiia bacterium]